MGPLVFFHIVRRKFVEQFYKMEGPKEFAHEGYFYALTCFIPTAMKDQRSAPLLIWKNNKEVSKRLRLT